MANARAPSIVTPPKAKRHEDGATAISQRQLVESPTRVSPGGRMPARTTSGRFEDPMLVWRSSQSDDAMSPSPSTPACHGGQSHSPSATRHHPPLAQPSHHPSYPSSPSKAFRAPESASVLDSVQPPSASSPHSPATLMSPIRSQSPTTRSVRSSGVMSAGGSPASAMSPSASLFDKLRMFGGRSLFGSSGQTGPASEGGGRSPKSKSLTFAGLDDLASDEDKSRSYTISPTHTSHATSPAVPIPGSGSAPYTISPWRQSSRDSTEFAAAAAVASVDNERTSNGGSGADVATLDRDRLHSGSGAGSTGDPASTAGRTLSQVKSLGGRSMGMGGRPLNINPSWRSSGALTLSTTTSGAGVEGGLQSQTHEALQQLLGSTGAGTLSAELSNKRISAPGHGQANGATGGSLGSTAIGGGGRSIRSELGVSTLSHSHHNLKLSHDEPPKSNGNPGTSESPRLPEPGYGTRFASDGGVGVRFAASEDKPSVRFGAVSDGGGLVSSMPRGGRRISRSATDKQLEEQLAQAVSLERSYADLHLGQDDHDDDGF